MEGGGAWFTVPACAAPIQKLLLPRCDWKTLTSHLHWWWVGKGEQKWKKGGGEGGSGRMTSPSLKCHHYLKPRLSRLQRWHHPIFGPPPSVLLNVVREDVSLCVRMQPCVRAPDAALSKEAWVDVYLCSLFHAFKMTTSNVPLWAPSLSISVDTIPTCFILAELLKKDKTLTGDWGYSRLYVSGFHTYFTSFSAVLYLHRRSVFCSHRKM